MGTGYCIHCKEKVELVKPELGFFKNGTPIERGNCPKCTAKLIRMLKKEEKEAYKNKNLTGEGIHEQAKG